MDTGENFFHAAPNRVNYGFFDPDGDGTTC